MINRKREEIKAKKDVLLKNMKEIHKCFRINIRYLPDSDQFIAYCFVDRNDDNAYYTVYFDYNEVI